MKNNFDCGMRVKQLRIQHGLSQEELALNAEITTSYLGMIERGEKNPTVRIIEKLCNAMDVSLTVFFAQADTQEDKNQDETVTRLLCLYKMFTTEQQKTVLSILHQMLKFTISANE